MEDSSKSDNKTKEKQDPVKKALKLKIIISIVSSLGVFLPVIFIVVMFITVAITLGLIEVDTTGGGTTGGGSALVNECNFTIHSTSLTKTQYVSKIKDYYEQKDSNAKIFYDNAEKIYERAKSYGVNPEMVIIRAVVEGFSPEFTGKPNSNNYWGMGCTNTGGLSACLSYDSFMDGVDGFLENISQYDSLASMMSRYANLGNYWYNPGGWDIGGCKYAEYIYTSSNMPARVKTACADGNECEGSNCTPTTEQDKLAYSVYQVEKMSGTREDIFGLEGNKSCGIQVSTGDFIWPTVPATITSKFGPRIPPTPKSSRYHKGIDIGIGTGTDVYASATGVVTTKTYNDSRGYYIIIDHNNGMETYYQHLNEMLVKQGQIVKQGQVIAKSGNSGVGTGAHLHFEIHENGEAVDPLKFVTPPQQ